MARSDRKSSAPQIQARAFVVPTSTGNLGRGEEGNVDNTSHRAKVRSSTLLVLRWVADGGPIPTDTQRVKQHLSNWLRLVMHHAGSNYEPADRFPAEILLPVWIDQATRRIVRIDTDLPLRARLSADGRARAACFLPEHSAAAWIRIHASLLA